MDAKLLNAIINSTSSVLSNKLNCNVKRKEPYARTKAEAKGTITAVVAVAGRVQGTVLLSVTPNLAAHYAGTTANANSTELAAAAIRLVQNIMEETDWDLRVVTENIIDGGTHRVNYPANITPICLPFESSLGDIDIVVGLTEGEEEEATQAAAPEKIIAELQEEQQRTSEVIDLVAELTASVHQGVSSHSTTIKEVSAELKSQADEESVLKAIARLVEANQMMEEQLSSAENRLQEQAQIIETHAREARTDALTGLNNRRAFDNEMNRALSNFKECGKNTSMMLIDVDHFKTFNDTHGHQAGDEVLKFVAQAVQKSVRDSDIVARYGGEEFAVIFPGTNAEDAASISENARKAIARQVVEFEGKRLRVTASAGLTDFKPDDNCDKMIQRADEALYASKEAGRNCGHLHDGAGHHLVS